jgi:hypothetical protein
MIGRDTSRRFKLSLAVAGREKPLSARPWVQTHKWNAARPSTPTSTSWLREIEVFVTEFDNLLSGHGRHFVGRIIAHCSRVGRLGVTVTLTA